MANAPEMIAAWPFEWRDMRDGSKAWSGGQWGKPGATMPDAKLFVQKAVMDTRIEAERRKALEEAAMFCEHHSMDTVTNPEAAEFAGSYVASEALGGGGRHAGMGYAAAIRALMEKEQGE